MKKILSILLLGALVIMNYGCKDDDPEPVKPTKPPVILSTTSVTLKVGETKNITIQNYDTTVFVDNTNIASVDKMGDIDYKITARKVGKTFINLGSKKLNINVNKYYFYFRDPIFTWGEGKNPIKSYELRSLISDEPNALVYRELNSDELNYLIYNFYDYKLYSISLYILSAKTSELGNYLNDYFVQIASTSPEYDMYQSPIPSDDPMFFNVRVNKTPQVYNDKEYWLVELTNPNYAPTTK
jgi:hypothetical protein